MDIYYTSSKKRSQQMSISDSIGGFVSTNMVSGSIFKDVSMLSYERGRSDVVCLALKIPDDCNRISISSNGDADATVSVGVEGSSDYDGEVCFSRSINGNIPSGVEMSEIADGVEVDVSDYESGDFVGVWILRSIPPSGDASCEASRNNLSIVFDCT